MAMEKSFKQQITGLIIGKFCPLHLGHEHLINHALKNCDKLVIVSYTKPEFPHCAPINREMWLHTRFPQAKYWVIDDKVLKSLCLKNNEAPREIPENDASETIHRGFVAWLCHKILKVKINKIFTSEDYGEGFVQYMQDYFQPIFPSLKITHELVDLHRTSVPINATKIRLEPQKHKKFLSPEVYAFFVKRLCFLGGESTGKSTLTQLVAKTLQAEFVLEYGRELWESKRGNLQFEDMLTIAETQIQGENAKSLITQDWLICDTSPLTTFFYSLDLFGKADKTLELLSWRPYDLVFLCAPDFDFVQDGTRRDPAFREKQHQWYLKTLEERNIPYVILEGSIESRIKSILAILSKTK